MAPRLTLYEVLKGLVRAGRPGLRAASQRDRSAYDAAYLVLARRNGWELVTGEGRFLQAVSGESPFVRRVEDLASRI